jgi:hypothetical protein
VLLRLLLIGYLYGIASERRLLEEVRMQAMRACWKDGYDKSFNAFFGLFKQLMLVDLARYSSKVPFDQVCDASRDEIRHEFSQPEEKNFD